MTDVTVVVTPPDEYEVVVQEQAATSIDVVESPLEITVEPPDEVVAIVEEQAAIEVEVTESVLGQWVQVIGYYLVAGENIAFGEPSYVSTADGLMYRARSGSTLELAEALAICGHAGGITSGNSGLFVFKGILNGISGGANGALAYLGAAAGSVQTTVPSYPTNNYSKILGRFLSPSRLYFSPSDYTVDLTV